MDFFDEISEEAPDKVNVKPFHTLKKKTKKKFMIGVKR